MAPFALGQRKCHRTVTAAAIFAIQNIKHAEFGCARLVFENLFMAIAACQPFGMLFVRKIHHVHFTGVGKQYVQVKYFGPNVRPEFDARVDITIVERFEPIDLIAASTAGQRRKNVGWILE